jgi:ACS family glucarate transporter-like MFS transporter
MIILYNSDKNQGNPVFQKSRKKSLHLAIVIPEPGLTHPPGSEQRRGCIDRLPLSVMKQIIPYRYRVLLFLFFLTFITYLDRITISLVGIHIKSEFHLTNTQFGVVLAAFSLAYALFEIPSGILGDRIGQKKVLIRIVIWWSLFTALTGLTTGFISLLLIRFLFGVGESGAFPNSGGVVARWFPVNETSRGVSWLMIGSNLGAAFAPLLVLPVSAAFGWRSSFYVNGCIGLLWVAVCVYWFRNHPSEMKGITPVERKFIEDNRRIKSHFQRFNWLLAFRSRSVWGLLVCYLTTQWALYFFVAWMPVYLQEGRHFAESEMKSVTSWLFILGALGAFIAGFLLDWLAKTFGLLNGRRIGGFISVILMAIAFFTAAATQTNWVVILCFLSGNFLVWYNIVCGVSVVIDIGRERSATLYGLLNFFGQMGAFFSAIVFGKIVDVTHNYNTPLYLMGVLLIAGALSWLFIRADKPLFEGDDHTLVQDKTVEFVD